MAWSVLFWDDVKGEVIEAKEAGKGLFSFSLTVLMYDLMYGFCLVPRGGFRLGLIFGGCQGFTCLMGKTC